MGCGHLNDPLAPVERAARGAREAMTRQLGDDWLRGITEAFLVVPSVIMPIAAAPDRNVLIDHRRAESARIAIAEIVPFALDPRLFNP